MVMIGARNIPLASALALLVALAVLHASPSPAATGGVTAGPAPGAVRDGAVPDKARAVLAEIQKRKGEAPAGYVGGRVFGNRERRLPHGSYREYDVNPKKPGKNRGAERIVIEQRTGKAYYSPDHYESFIPMN